MIAQLTAAAALVAAVSMPGWSEVSPEPAPAAAVPVTPEAPAAVPVPVEAVVPAAPVDSRPAHLNLDFRHKFRSVDLTVSVDGKRVLDTKLEGAGKKFGVFGGRGERSFTRTLDLAPGSRVVRLHVRSTADKFEHTRVERFDLGPATVAAMRVGVDKSGLDVMTDRPPAPRASEPAPAPAPLPTSASALTPPVAPSAAVSQSGMVGELYQTLRRLLIALAGFIASVSAAYLFEEFLKSRRLPFLPQAPAEPVKVVQTPVRRKSVLPAE